MHVIGTYHIEVQGIVDAKAFNKTSPLQITVDRADAGTTLLNICADQAGLIGLIRHLHQQGFVLVSVIMNKE